MIKNIIFDFGDVFINLDKEATARMLIKFGFAGITPELMLLFEQYEVGRINSDDFVDRASQYVPQANRNQLIDAWNAVLLDFPEYRLSFLEGLARESRYRLFLLSNTNALHIDKVGSIMGDKDYGRFTNSFEHCYFSHEIHLRKPNADIFEHVISEQGLLAPETLFIDDTGEHIATANKLGLATWHLQVGKEDVVELKHKGIL